MSKSEFQMNRSEGVKEACATGVTRFESPLKSDHSETDNSELQSMSVSELALLGSENPEIILSKYGELADATQERVKIVPATLKSANESKAFSGLDKESF